MNRTLLTALAIVSLGAPLLYSQASFAEQKAGEKAESCDVKKIDHKNMATGPAEEMSLVSFLEGEWDITERYIKDGKALPDDEATISFNYILDGAAIQYTYRGVYGEGELAETGILTYNRYAKSFEQAVMNSHQPMTKVYRDGTAENGKITLVMSKTKGDKVWKSRRTYELIDSDHMRGTLDNFKDGRWITFATEDYTRS